MNDLPSYELVQRFMHEAGFDVPDPNEEIAFPSPKFMKLASRLIQYGAAQSEPEGPTDEEILALSQWHGVSYTLTDGSVIYPFQEGADMKDAVLSFTRAVLARWGK